MTGGMPISGLLDLRKSASWPMDLRSYLESHHDLFPGWEQGGVAARLYDQAIYGLIDVLQPYAITGWHCTRLTDAEIHHILRDGMRSPVHQCSTVALTPS